jgi:hypothetical protein
MGAPGRFEQAQALARDAASAAATGQQVAVIAFDDRATVVAAPGGEGFARSAIGGLKAGSGATRFAPLFARVQETAGSAPAQLVIVSDLQRAGWSEEAPPSIAGNIDVEIRQVGEIKGNVAIAAIRRSGDEIVLTLANGGNAAASGTARISVDRQEKATAPFNVPAGATTDVTVHYRAPDRGVLTAAIDDAAGFPADNTRVLLLDASSRPRVTVVSGADGESGFYVARALQSVDGEDGFDVDERTATSLAGVSNEQLARSATVVLLSTRGLDRRSRDAIAAYVRNGGGLLVAASDDVEASVLATTMGWQGFTAAAQAEPAGVLAPVDLRHPIFRPFGALAANLGEGHFDRTWTLRGDGWDVLARFTNGAAALVERHEGKGRVVLFASDVSRRWNDFPLTPAFVPFAVETVRYTGAATDRRRDYVVADAPAGVPPEAGVYETGGRRIVVNVDPRESAPASMTAADFTKLLKPADTAPAAPLEVQAQRAEGRQNLWRYGLLLMMLALVAESMVGRPAQGITGV